MPGANEAIVRERLPFPSVEEVLEEFSGSTVFSRLQWGFEDSRDITTFMNHEYLFRYKLSSVLKITWKYRL